MPARMKFLCDIERCIDCNGCVTACKNENETPWGVNRRRVVTVNDGQPGEFYVSVACMHCTDAPCMAVCPVDCFYHPEDGVVLHAKDRGCTAPGCSMPGYLCEVHHVDEWAAGGLTDIDTLTFACGPHHRLITPGGWKTRKLKIGNTEWIPPPGLPSPSGTNDYHHPERLLPGA